MPGMIAGSGKAGAGRIGGLGGASIGLLNGLLAPGICGFLCRAGCFCLLAANSLGRGARRLGFFRVSDPLRSSQEEQDEEEGDE